MWRGRHEVRPLHSVGRSWTGDRLDLQEHIEFGKVALELDLIDVDALCRACAELALEPSVPGLREFWVGRSYLNEHHLGSVQAFLDAHVQPVTSLDDFEEGPSTREGGDFQDIIRTRPTHEFLEHVGVLRHQEDLSLADVLYTIGPFADGELPLERAEPPRELVHGENTRRGIVVDPRFAGSAAPLQRSCGEHSFTSGSSPSRLARANHSAVTRDRYILGRVLGRGGGGLVLRAFDRAIGRSVAMKVLAEPEEGKAHERQTLQRFIAEAQTAGQLEHPNIVPIYDTGVLADGRLYYTMKEVRRHSLREVLQGLRRRDELLSEEYTLTRLLNIFLQVCQAMHFAHARSVVHRDLKPDNIMLGDFGEVLVMDWGLARVGGSEVVTDFSLEGGERTSPGRTLGTPAYMPPEQARGELDLVDERSDIYALGAVLYEILTLEPPFVGESPYEVMVQVVDDQVMPPRRRAPEREVPEDLEEICLRAMASNRYDRFASARGLIQGVELFLEGIRSREAFNRCTQANQHAESYFRSVGELRMLERAAREASSGVEGWEDIGRKRPMWQLQDDVKDAQQRSAQAFGRAVTAYTEALAHDSQNARARQGLTQLYWSRFQLAESKRQILDQIYFEALLRQYDDGTYFPLLEGHGTLTLATFPEGAEVFLQPLQERDRKLHQGPSRYLGRSPLHQERLPMGSYMLTVRREPFKTLAVPVMVGRCRDINLAIDLLTEEQIGEDFVYIPAGECIVGGDDKAFDPMERQEVFLEAFLIARYPVTFRDYLEFVNDSWRADPSEARRLLPRTRGAEGALARFDPELGMYVPDSVIIEGSARDRYPEGKGVEWDLPIVGVSFDDAVAYILWRSRRDRTRYRLPTEREWEKAARGVDGRVFPWGEHFDPTFCKMLQSRPEHAQPEPVGIFKHDRSPFGVRDLAGGVREFVADQPSSEQPLLSGESTCAVRGGGWNQDIKNCRIASRMRVLRRARNAGIGFRLCKDAPLE